MDATFYSLIKRRSVENETKNSDLLLRFPKSVDVTFYIIYILTGGILALVGASIFLSYMGFFDVDLSILTPKNKTFLIVFSFLIGLYEIRFLAALSKLADKLFKKNLSYKKDES